eukprot:2505848-Lingulodinium_polyedra.AAC.1
MHIESAVGPLKAFFSFPRATARPFRAIGVRACVCARVRACARAFARVRAATSAARGARVRQHAGKQQCAAKHGCRRAIPWASAPKI